MFGSAWRRLYTPTDSRTHSNAAPLPYPHPKSNANSSSTFAHARRAPADCCAKHDANFHRDHRSTFSHADARPGDECAHRDVYPRAAAASAGVGPAP